jgi:hypothetical protein
MTDGNSFSTYNSNAPILLSNNGAQSLPVTLTNFTVKQEGSTAFCEWATASELNASKFIIERSVNGGDWNLIGETPAHGTSTQNQYYSFRDVAPTEGEQYYRLLQLDIDGTQHFSPIVSLNFSSHSRKNYISLSHLKNAMIVDDEVTDDIQSIILSSLDGKAILKSGEENFVDLPGSLTPGIYVAQVLFKNGKTERQLLWY